MQMFWKIECAYWHLPYSGKLLREKTFANWWKIWFSGRKLLLIACFCRAKGRHAPNFTEKTFMNSHKTAKFAQVFSLESFPLYSTSAQSCEGLLPACSVGVKGTGSEDDSCWMHFQHESSFSTHDNLLSYGYATSLTIMQQGNLRVKAGSWMQGREFASDKCCEWMVS